MGIKKISMGGGGGSFSGTMDDIPNGLIYVKTENNLTDAEKTILSNTSGTNSGDNAVNSLYSGLAASKQDTLVSATNIKTINGSSVLGSGNLVVTSTPSDITQTRNTPTSNQTILTGYSAIICDEYEIANTLSLEIQNNAKIEIS